MGFLTAILILAMTGLSSQYSLAPELTWPEEYHFNAEQIDLVTGIVKPFEVWYSTEHNRSRIDFFGGTVSRYYYGDYENEGRGKIYMIHPEVSKDDTQTEVKCEMVRDWSDQKDFLPGLYEFEYAGTQEHDGKEVQVWKKSEDMRGIIRVDETLLVEEIDQDVGIPLHHYTQSWNLQDGSLSGDTVINYYNYDNKIPLKVLNADDRECAEWSTFTEDFHEAVKVLHPTINSDVDLAFHRFKRHHYRYYVDTEHHARKTVFKHNWNLVVDHNNKNLGYTLGLNQFADKLMSELSYLSGVKVTDPIRGTHPFPHSQEELASMAEELPEEFDLRTLGVITPVRNQAQCGSCWAFAMAATMEGALARVNGGKLMDLSEQSLVDCAWAFQSHGCMGTEAIDAVFGYVMKHGIPTVQEYGPYLEEDGFCKINNMSTVYKIKGFTGVTRNSANAMKAAVYKYGPVTIGVMVTEHMVFYKSGVFYDMHCPENPAAMNHAVTLIGYGVRHGDLFWIVKNSWGESWGESGYILIRASKNNCNVMTSPFYPIL